MATENLQVSSNRDDMDEVEPFSNPGDTRDNATVTLAALDGGFPRIHGGFRFTGVTIPKDSTINSATLKLWSISGTGLAVDIYGEESASAGQFTAGTANFDITGRSKTSNTVFWSETDLTDGQFNNKSVTAIIQELVNTYALSTIVMLAIARNNHSDRSSTIHAYNSSPTSRAAKLEIDYDAPVTFRPKVMFF